MPINKLDTKAVTRPYFSKLGLIAAALKTNLKQQALTQDMSCGVLDADPLYKHRVRLWKTGFKPHKYFYGKKVIHNEFNSGVLIAKNESKGENG